LSFAISWVEMKAGLETRREVGDQLSWRRT